MFHALSVSRSAKVLVVSSLAYTKKKGKRTLIRGERVQNTSPGHKIQHAARRLS